jgi:malate dehydrogenase
MQKIAIIGSGNVGSQTALFLISEGISNILLLDTIKGLAKGKALDLEDCAAVLGRDCRIEGGDDFSLLAGCQIVVITAGLSRKPAMTRDDLLIKNSEIINDVSLKIKKYCVQPIVIVVTNPVDVMTQLVSKASGFDTKMVFGMGISLDAARFANLIRSRLSVPIAKIEPVVLGSHGQTMVPAPHLTTVCAEPLDKSLDKGTVAKLMQSTVERGASIIAHLGEASAYFAPGAAIAGIVRAIVKDEKRIIGVCAYCNGEYGIKGLYIGVPAKIGKNGVEGIVELELSADEKVAFLKSAESIRQQINSLNV